MHDTRHYDHHGALHRRQRASSAADVADGGAVNGGLSASTPERAEPVLAATTAGAGTQSSTSSTSAATTATTTTTSAAATTTTTPSSSSEPRTTTTATTTSETTESSSTSTTTTTTTTTTEEPTTTTSSTTTATTTTTSSPAPTTTTSSSTTTTSSTTLSTSSTTTEETTSSTRRTSSLVPSTRTTIVVVNGRTSTSTSVSSGTALASSNSSSSSPSTGAVVGIVAGALAGAILLAYVVVTLFRRRRSSDDDEPSPFDKEEFRRTSAMLDDGMWAGGSFGGSHHGSSHHDNLNIDHWSADGHHAGPEMAEYSHVALGRSNTVMSGSAHSHSGGHGAASLGHMHGPSSSSLPGLARGNTLDRPRPPTAILNHFNHLQQQQQHQQHAMPSYQPGQVVGAGVGAGFPTSAFNEGLYAPQHVPQRAPVGEWNAVTSGQGWSQQRSPSPLHSQQGHLERGPSNASAYSSRSDGILAPLPVAAVGNLGARGFGGGAAGSPNLSREATTSSWEDHQRRHRSPRPLSHVQEELHGGNFSDGAGPTSVPARSGTPVDSNPQQVFSSSSLRRSDSFDEGDRRGSIATTLPGYTVFAPVRDRDEDLSASRNADYGRRRLSVRNGGLDEHEDDDDDAYGGM